MENERQQRRPAATFTEDDFGRQMRVPKHKGRGVFTPQHRIGARVTDLHESERYEGIACVGSGPRSKLAFGTLCPSEELPRRPLAKEVGDPKVDMQKPWPAHPRPTGRRYIDFIPLPSKAPEDGAKRCYDWVYKPTGYENPVQYEEPAEPGKRPSHPVCAAGVVAVEHRRNFPEIQHAQTAIPPPRLCKAPHDSWGGWAKGGAPGRRRQDGPWDSIQPRSGSNDGQTAEFLFCDARTKRFPEMKYQPTFALTSWHLDPRRDLDVRRQPSVHLNDAVSVERGAMLDERMTRAPAGKPSGQCAEGAALSFYDKVREWDDEVQLRARATTAPHSARY